MKIQFQADFDPANPRDQFIIGQLFGMVRGCNQIHGDSEFSKAIESNLTAPFQWLVEMHTGRPFTEFLKELDLEIQQFRLSQQNSPGSDPIDELEL